METNTPVKEWPERIVKLAAEINDSDDPNELFEIFSVLFRLSGKCRG